MITNPSGKKTALQAEKELDNLLNQYITEVGREMKSLQRQKEQARMTSIINTMVMIMRDNGASEQTIQKALPGFHEFAKYAIREDYNQLASKLENRQPAPAGEAPGLFLSDIAAQEVRWLWQKRIPLGKITILDGDPGMGKSLLAINIAARVSTGQPMPDGTPGTQGGVILIAPEDGAGDTLRPRLEAAGGDPSQVLLLNLVESLNAKKVKVNDRPFSLSQDLEVL